MGEDGVKDHGVFCSICPRHCAQMLPQQSLEDNHTPTAWADLLAAIRERHHIIKARTARFCKSFTYGRFSFLFSFNFTYLYRPLLDIWRSLFMPFYSILVQMVFQMCTHQCINQTDPDTLLPGDVLIYLYISQFQFFQCWSSVFCLSFGVTYSFFIL